MLRAVDEVEGERLNSVGASRRSSDETHTNNKFITTFSQILMNNIHAEASYRCSASQTLELFEEALYSIDARTIASIA